MPAMLYYGQIKADSGSSRSLTEVWGSPSPAYVASGPGGMPTIRFNNGGGIGRTSSSWGTLSQPCTVFVVCYQDNPDATDYILDSTNSSNRLALTSGIDGSTRYWKVYGGSSVYTQKLVAEEALIHTIVYYGSSSEHYIDGVLVKTGDVGSGSFDGITLGMHVLHTGNALDGDISEVLFYDKVLTRKEIQKMEGYLTGKYKLGCDESSIVVDRGDSNYNTFRLPTIICTQSGTLLMACEGRKDSPGDLTPSDIVIKRSFDKGQTWLPNNAADTIIYGDGDATLADPVLVYDAEIDRVFLLYSRYPANWESQDPKTAGYGLDSVRTYCMASDDVDDSSSDPTWTSPNNITSSIKESSWYGVSCGPGNGGIQLIDGPYAGRLVVAIRIGGNTAATKGNGFIYSDNHGTSWQRAGNIVPDMDRSMECTIVRLADGYYLMNMRPEDEYTPWRRITYRSDQGGLWSDPELDTHLITPFCHAGMVYHTLDYDDNRLLFSNPADDDMRTNITVRVSIDDGETWLDSRSLNYGSTTDYSTSFNGYSSLVILDDNSLGCIYECGSSNSYSSFRFQRFKYSWLENRTSAQLNY